MASTQILEDLKNGKCSIEEAQEKLSKLKLAELRTVTYKVSPKGGLSFYGLRRMPITLYSSELEKIMSIANSDEFKRFMVDNKSRLSTKGGT